MGKFVEVANQTFKLIFDTDDLDKMFATNVLSENDSIELIEGEILARRETVKNEFSESERIALILQESLGSFAKAKTQQLIQLNEIQLVRPSIVLSKNSVVETRQIQASDVILAIELADSRYNYADNPRAKYYGLPQFPEVWFVILNLGLIEVCTKPNYGFSQCRTYRRGELIKSELIPNLEIEVDKILGE